jgi:hypothetical protein
MADPPQETVSEDKGGYRWCVNDGLDRQAEVGGDLLVESERIPAVEDDLLMVVVHLLHRHHHPAGLFRGAAGTRIGGWGPVDSKDDVTGNEPVSYGR